MKKHRIEEIDLSVWAKRVEECEVRIIQRTSKIMKNLEKISSDTLNNLQKIQSNIDIIYQYSKTRDRIIKKFFQMRESYLEHIDGMINEVYNLVFVKTLNLKFFTDSLTAKYNMRPSRELELHNEYIEISRIQVNEGKLKKLLYLSGSLYLCISTCDYKAIIKCLKTGKIKAEHCHNTSVLDIEFSRNKKYFVSFSSDFIIKVSDLKDKEKRSTEFIFTGVIMCVFIDDDYNYLVVGSSDCLVTVWSLLRIGEEFKYPHDDTVNCVTMSKDNVYIISGSSDSKIKIFHIESRNVEQTFDCSYQVLCIVLLESSELYKFQIIAGLSNGKIHMLSNIPEDKCILPSHHNSSVICLCLNSSQTILVSGSADKTIKIWNIGNKNLLQTLHSHTNIVNCLAFSNDNSFLCSGSWDRYFTLYRRKESKFAKEPLDAPIPKSR